MSEKLNIEQLIRTRLEDAELAPSQDTWKGILRTYRWRQFLRFHPARFNIYYASAILLAGTGLLLLLLGNQEVQDPVDLPDESVTATKEELTVREEVMETGPAKSGQTIEEESTETGRSIESQEKEEYIPFEESNSESAETSTLKDPEKAEEVAAPMAAVSPINNEPSEAPLPFSYFASSAESGCAPLEVKFINQSVNATSYRWSFGTGDESAEREPVYVFTAAGRYTVTLTAENQGGKLSVSRRLIEVFPKPVADFQIEEGLEGTDNHVVLNLLNYSSAASNYSWCLVDEDGKNCSQWSSAEFQPTIEVKRITPESRAVQLEVTSMDGCSDTVRIDLPLEVESSEVKIKFPTAFSPNPSGPGDGSFSPQSKRIDLFHPVFVEVPVEYRMRVFNRRGELVFETRELYQGWDGYVQQEQAPADVYVWMVEGRWIDGRPFGYHGDVTLVRNPYW